MKAVGAVRLGEINASESVTNLTSQNLDKNRESTIRASKNRQNALNASTDGVHEGRRSKIENIAQALDQYMKSTQKDLEIQIHEATGNIIVKVLSKEDGKVLREIPPEKMLNLAAKMEEMAGILFNENV